MMGSGCGGRHREADREKGIVEVVNLVVSACKSSLAPLSLPLYESPPALHCFINTHLYPGSPFHLLSLLPPSDEEERNRRKGEEEEVEVGGWEAGRQLDSSSTLLAGGECAGN